MGSSEANEVQDIMLSGSHIQPEHCVFENKSGHITLIPMNGALTYVNGREVINITTIPSFLAFILLQLLDHRTYYVKNWLESNTW